MADEKNEVVETAEEPAVAEKVEEKKAAPSKNIEKILESIEKMTVLEMAELVKALEDKFGVSAAAPMAMMAAPAAGAGGGADEEKTEWDVVLAETGEKKFQVVKVIRQVTDLSSRPRGLARAGPTALAAVPSPRSGALWKCGCL